MPYAKGKLPPVHTEKTMRSAIAFARQLDQLGPAPAASNDYTSAVDRVTGGSWGMFKNDDVGDCTCADSCHQIMLHTANTGQLLIPDENDAIVAYSAITGYDPNTGANDNGAAELGVCEYMKTTGIRGHKSVSYGSIDPRNLDHIKWCIQIFGVCRFGLDLAQSFEDQFGAGVPITYVSGSPSVGGHDVPGAKYDPTYCYVISWGRLVPVTWEALQSMIDEAHQELYPDWITSQGTTPSGLNLEALSADLIAIQNS